MNVKQLNPYIRVVLIYIAASVALSTLLVATNAVNYLVQELKK